MNNEKEKFEAYVKVQESGLTNMFDGNRVAQLAFNYSNVILEHFDIQYIMRNYSELKEKYDA